MIQTKYGPFDGNSWEALCQLIFKHKYGEQGYQEMPASPGDFGIEGFVNDTETAFQCYCPNLHYSQDELYDAQRNKVTRDLKKLKKYEGEIARRIGTKKIKRWVFVCPEINRNKLLRHAQEKQNEIRKWELSILDDDVEVILKDADFFAQEIAHMRQIGGEKVIFQIEDVEFQYVGEDISEHEENVSRKNKARCMTEKGLDISRHEKLNLITIRKLFDGETLTKKIESDSASIYINLVRIINQYEDEVEEMSLTWRGEPEDLINRVKNTLSLRIKESIPSLGDPERHIIADHMVSKWIALCPLDFE